MQPKLTWAFLIFLIVTTHFSTAQAEERVAQNSSFAVLANGLIIDQDNNIMWASEDNKEDINWFAAVEYCANFARGGYTDWRLPTVKELASISTIKANNSGLYVNNIFTLSDFFLWSKEEHTCKSSCYNFLTREMNKFPKARVGIARVIPVRDIKGKEK